MTKNSESGVVLYAGGRGRVVAVRLADGTCPALDFLNGLDPRAQAGFRVLFERLTGQRMITNQERFRKLKVAGRPAVFEWKVTTLRPCGSMAFKTGRPGMPPMAGRSRVIVGFRSRWRRHDASSEKGEASELVREYP